VPAVLLRARCIPCENPEELSLPVASLGQFSLLGVPVSWVFGIARSGRDEIPLLGPPEIFDNRSRDILADLRSAPARTSPPLPPPFDHAGIGWLEFVDIPKPTALHRPLITLQRQEMISPSTWLVTTAHAAAPLVAYLQRAVRPKPRIKGFIHPTMTMILNNESRCHRLALVVEPRLPAPNGEHHGHYRNNLTPQPTPHDNVGHHHG